MSATPETVEIVFKGRDELTAELQKIMSSMKETGGLTDEMRARFAQLRSELREQVSVQRTFQIAWRESHEVFSRTIEIVGQVGGMFRSLIGIFTAYNTMQLRVAQAQDRVNEAAKKSADAWEEYNNAMRESQQVMADLAEKYSRRLQDINEELARTIENLRERQAEIPIELERIGLRIADLEARLRKLHREATEALKEYEEAVRKYGASSIKAIEAWERYQSILRDIRETELDLIEARKRQAELLKEQAEIPKKIAEAEEEANRKRQEAAKEYEEAVRKHQEQLEQLRKAAEKADEQLVLAQKQYQAATKENIIQTALLGVAMVGVIPQVWKLASSVIALKAILGGVTAAGVAAAGEAIAIGAAAAVAISAIAGLVLGLVGGANTVAGTIWQWYEGAKQLPPVLREIAMGITWLLAKSAEVGYAFGQMIREFIVQAGQALSQFGAVVGSFFAGIGAAIVNFFAPVGEAVYNALAPHINAIIKIFTLIGEIATLTGQIIALVFVRLGEVIVSALQAVATALAPVWEAITNAAQAAWNAIVEGARTVLGAVVAFLAPFISQIQSAFASLWDAIQSGWNTLIGWIGEALGALGSIADAAMKAVWNAIVGWLESIKGALEAFFNWLAGRSLWPEMFNLMTKQTEFGMKNVARSFESYTLDMLSIGEDFRRALATSVTPPVVASGIRPTNITNYNTFGNIYSPIDIEDIGAKLAYMMSERLRGRRG